MKESKKYQKKASITYLPFPTRYQSVLRVEINPLEFTNENLNYLLSFQSLVKKLRELKFMISTEKSEFNNHPDYKNVIQIVIEPYSSPVEIAKDLQEELEEIFGVNSVINQVRIKGK